MSAADLSTTTSGVRRVAARAVVRAEARLFLRELGALAWIVAFPVVLLTILGLIPPFRRDDPDLGGQSVIDLYVPICLILSMLMAGVQAMPSVLAGYRESGVLRRLRTTPVHPRTLLEAQVVLHGLASLAGTLLVLGVGRIAFGTPLPGRPVVYVVLLVLTLLSCLALGALITAVAPSTKAATALGTVVFFPSMFTSGVWLPVQAMPHLMQQIVVLTPLGAAARALNDVALGDWPRLVDLVVTAGWTAVLALAAVRLFRWE